MAVQYSGAALSTTFSGTTRTELVDNLKGALVSAGWSVASGVSGDWKLDSATAPSGHRIRVRLYDPGTGNCARARLMTVDELIAPATDMFLLPQATAGFRIFANPYQFFVIVPGTYAPRTYLAGGVPWLPAFLTPSYCGWLAGNAQSDTDTSDRHSFRYSTIGPCHDSSCESAIYGNSGWGSTSFGAGEITLLGYRYEGRGYADRARKWADGSAQVYEPLIAWGITSISDTAVIIGQIWDAIVIEGSYSMDTVVEFDGRTWWIIFHSVSATNKACLALLVP